MKTLDCMEPLASVIATAMSRIEGDRQRLRLAIATFEAEFGASRVDAWFLTIEGCPSSREVARGHAGAAQAMTRLLQGHPVAARLELFALPWFRGQVGSSPGRDEDGAFAQASAAELLHRLEHLVMIEAAERLAPPFLAPAAFAAYQPMVYQLGLSWGRYLNEAFRMAARVDPETFAESWLYLVLQLEDKGLSFAIRDAMENNMLKGSEPRPGV
jgi:hypothetical protein